MFPSQRLLVSPGHLVPYESDALTAFAVRPKAVVLASYASLEEAGDAVVRVVASGLLPGAMETMDALAIEAAEAAVGAGYPEGAEAVLIVELAGPREEIEMEEKKLAELIEAAGAWEVGALDLEPPSTLVMRMGGHPESLKVRFARLADTTGLHGDLLTEDEDKACWQSLRDCSWADEHAGWQGGWSACWTRISRRQP